MYSDYTNYHEDVDVPTLKWLELIVTNVIIIIIIIPTPISLHYEELLNLLLGKPLWTKTLAALPLLISNAPLCYRAARLLTALLSASYIGACLPG